MKTKQKKFVIPKVRKVAKYSIVNSARCLHLRSTGCQHTYNN